MQTTTSNPQAFASCPRCHKTTQLEPSGSGWRYSRHGGREAITTVCSMSGGTVPSDATIATAQPERVTVKALDIFGVVHDTYATETELNGWKPTQGRML